jgi:hypothetical protein
MGGGLDAAKKLLVKRSRPWVEVHAPRLKKII